TLYASGVYMGACLNPSGDLIPPQDMYDACRVFARYVQWKGDLEWDWQQALDAEIPEGFTSLLQSFLASVLKSRAGHKGWKIPETTLVYPWIARMYPEIKYIFWIRNPRDCILGGHVTDDMQKFGVSYPATEDERLRRAISWKYQYDLVRAVPKPANWLEVRFEDFVLKQEETLARLEDFLEMKLARIIVRPDAVERWRHDDGVNYFDFLGPAMREYGYEIPE
ncbi:MAG: sulfotransferase, partial [Anaerolineae bacterium]